MPVPTTNLVLDIKAGVGETLSGSEITSIADQSGLGNNCTGQTGNTSKPLSVTDELGQAAILFPWMTGASHPKAYFDIPASVSGIATRSTTVYAVWRMFTGVEDQCMVSFDGFASAYAGVRQTSASAPYMTVATRNSTTYLPLNKSVYVWGGRAADTVVQWNHTRQDGITSPGSATGLAGGDIGRYGTGANTYISGFLYRLLIYNTPHTNAQIDTVVAALEADHPVVTSFTKMGVFVGDSLTQGVSSTNGLNYPNQVWNQLTSRLMFNVGSGGQKIGVLATAGTMANGQAARVDVLYPVFSGFTERAMYVLAGTNDIGGDALTGAQTYTRLTTWLTAAKSVGWKIYVQTLPDRGGTYRTQVADYNTLIRGGNSSYDEVVDVGYGSSASPRLDDNSNSTYYDVDGLHLKNAGYLVLANAMKAELDGTPPNPLTASVSPTVANFSIPQVTPVSDGVIIIVPQPQGSAAAALMEEATYTIGRFSISAEGEVLVHKNIGKFSIDEKGNIFLRRKKGVNLPHL